jgi:hypothetical protein
MEITYKFVFHSKGGRKARRRWLTPVNLATQEAAIRRIIV